MFFERPPQVFFVLAPYEALEIESPKHLCGVREIQVVKGISMVNVQPPSSVSNQRITTFAVSASQLGNLGTTWPWKTDSEFELSPGYGNFTPRAGRRGRHIVPMILRNTPLWLYFRSVRSSEKSVEVVADASLQVLANMTIDRGQRAAAALTYIR